MRRCSFGLARRWRVLLCAGAAGARTPIPKVTGPLPVTADSYPFGAADHQLVPQDLSRHGYVEEEYLDGLSLIRDAARADVP